MKEASIIGLDLAKRSFQAHGALADGRVAFRKKLTREKVLGFLAEQPRCVVAMEACGSAHHWGRAIRDAGHEVRLIPLEYVKPFVKRQKNGARTRRRLRKRRADRPCASLLSKRRNNRRAPCCFGHGISRLILSPPVGAHNASVRPAQADMHKRERRPSPADIDARGSVSSSSPL